MTKSQNIFIALLVSILIIIGLCLILSTNKEPKKIAPPEDTPKVINAIDPIPCNNDIEKCV